MGRGTIGPVYKDKQTQEELHVQEPKYFQGAQKQERRSQSGDQPQTDKLSSYTDTAGDVSLMSGQQKESIQFDVTATNIHETTNAQKLIDGQQLSEKKQAQLQQQEKELQGSVQTEKKKKKKRPSWIPCTRRFRSSRQSLTRTQTVRQRALPR